MIRKQKFWGSKKNWQKNEAREVNQIGLSLLAATVDVASGIAFATDGNPYNNYERMHLYRDVEQARAENAFEAQNLEDVMDAWKNSTIRKTTLDPNYAIRGKVFFPAFRNASYIKLYLPVDAEELEMTFKQVLIPVN